MEKLKDLYWLRFSSEERRRKSQLWKVLCKEFLSRYIGREASVLDLGAGCCEFINNIECAHKFAVDINGDIKKFTHEGVKVFVTSGANMREIPDESIDVVFASEFFEHLKDNDELFETLIEIRRILKCGGKLILICPNIRYLSDRYWDFIDHRLPLSHLSMQEALLLYEFNITKVIPKFLPYSTKNALPQWPVLLRIYLRITLLWSIFGKQMFIIAQKD